jgi:peptidoglycan/xylan/chitin deacetylase (PgdA/CDA1 family)
MVGLGAAPTVAQRATPLDPLGAGARAPLVTTSWDDGHPADLRVAELLARHGVSGTFYVPNSNVEGRPVMLSSEVRQLGRCFEVGGHTRDHVSLLQVTPDEAALQIGSNKAWLEGLLGREVGGFAYVRGHHNRTVKRLVRRAGFRYARTVRNLSASPGDDPFRMPTTVQFFAHEPAVYVRNYLTGGPTPRRLAALRAVLREKGLAERVHGVAGACLGAGRHFHLWGHSWEIEQHDLWGELDRLLGWLRRSGARFVTNGAWSAEREAAERLAGGQLADGPRVGGPLAGEGAQ